MDQNKNGINKVLLILFVGFWLCTIVNTILDFSFLSLVLTLLIYLPMTLFMLLNKHALGILILFLYCIFEIAMDLVGVFSVVINRNFNVVTILTIITSLLLFIAIFDRGIKIFRGKDLVNRFYLYALLGLFLCVMITSFVIDQVNTSFNAKSFIYDIIALIGNTILINTFIVYYLNETSFGEIELFK